MWLMRPGEGELRTPEEIRLFEQNQGLVGKFTHDAINNIIGYDNLYHYGIDKNDIRQIALIGLVRAIKTYTPEKGRLSTWAMVNMRHLLNTERNREWRLIRQPQWVIDVRQTINKFAQKFELAHGREPTAKEIAAGIKQSPASVKKVLELTTQTFENVHEPDKQTELELALTAKLSPPPNITERTREQLKQFLTEIAHTLYQSEDANKRATKVLQMYFGVGQEARQIQEIMTILGLKRMVVNNDIHRALKKIRKSPKLKNRLQRIYAE